MQTFEQLLDEWIGLKRQLDAITKKERALRKTLIQGAFPSPKEGTSNRELVDGRILKLNHQIKREVDEALVAGVKQRLRQASNELDVDALFKVKHSVSVTALRGLSDELKPIAQEAVITKPGSDSLTVV